MRYVAALEVLFRIFESRDQRPGSGACAPSVIVDRRCDAGREIRLAAGNRREGGPGGNLNSDIVCSLVLRAVATACCCYICGFAIASGVLYVQGRLEAHQLPCALGSRPLYLIGDVDRGALMKLSCHFGVALEWDQSIGSVAVLADNNC